MAIKWNNMILPEVINAFNVYRDGVQQIGITNEVSLAEIAAKTATIEGAGIAGSYDVPVVGSFDSIKQTIPFRSLTPGMVDFANPMAVQNLTLRGSLQVTDKNTGVSDYTGVRIVIRGRALSFNPGQLKNADAMNASVTIECMYFLYEVNGETLFEIDKLNGIYKVKGVDLMEKARQYC